MKKEYTKICVFNYARESYQLLLDENHKYFFLKINPDNTYSYIDFEIFKELLNIFANPKHILNIEENNGKTELIPKVLLKGVLVTLSLTTLLTLAGCDNKKQNFDRTIVPQTSTIIADVSEDSSKLEIKYDKNGKLFLETYVKSDMFNYDFVYDLSYLDNVLGYKSISISEILKEIQNNASIDNRFKDLLISYINAVIQNYPNADLRVFYENIKTLKIHECTKNELIKASLSFDSSGCYKKDENAIYVLKNCNYTPNSWEYQVIYHEFSHILRTALWQKNGREIRVKWQNSSNDGMVTGEALNSIFAVSLYNKEEKDIAYQLQSNYNSIILSCLDNYSLEDYVNKDYTYYLKCQDEYTNKNNYASYISALIEAQYNDYHNDNIKIDQDQFYPIYDYLLEIYFNKNINQDMSYSEAKLIADTIIEKITFDVPREYEIDATYMYSFFENYIQNLNIQNSVSR